MMKHIFSALVCCSVLFVGTSCAPQHTLPAPGPMVAPKRIVPEEWKLSNGMTVLFFEDHELPLVRGDLYFRGGALWPRQGKASAIAAMGDQMREGGAGALSPEALDRELENLSASIKSVFGAEFGKVSFAGLSADLPRLFDLFSDVTRRPKFDEARLALWRVQVLDDVRRRVDDPETIASLSAMQLLYQNSVYGKPVTSVEVRNVTRADLLSEYRRFVEPSRALLVITGDTTREAVAALVRSRFEDWKPQPAEQLVPPPITESPVPRVVFIPGPFQQSTIIAAQLGVPRLTPDYVAIEGANEILSGGFTSRLFARIRTELGLAYGVSGGVSPGIVKGMNRLVVQTRAEATAQALQEAYRVMAKLQQEGPAARELDESKRTITNTFVFKTASTQKVADRTALLRLLEYPENYDEVHLAKVAALTTEDITQVMRSRWDLRSLVVVVVGNETAYDALTKLRESDVPELASLPLVRASFKEKLELPH